MKTHNIKHLAEYPQKEVRITDEIIVSNTRPFTLLAGPCAIEGEDHALMMAEKLVEITDRLNIPFVYKSSYDKANRTSVNSKRGIGIEKGLPILAKVREEFGCPVLTDVHTPAQAEQAAEVVDVLQTPAFLCRQTDFIEAVAKTGKPVNVKKGQFLAPWDMQNVLNKFLEFDNDRVMLCERGASFGYNTLINDMTGIPVMAETGHPVVFDATHSVQKPGGLGTSTGGNRDHVPVLARAAVAVGVGAIFMETHQDPDCAPCDGPNMVHVDDLEAVLKQLVDIDRIIK
jgi:2-dehydro-3-deoxyphosphooctonate aldolase (KDO 8-P synthase)